MHWLAARTLQEPEREALEYRCAEAVWEYFVQREACGPLRDTPTIPMFAPTDRATLRDALIATARDDPRLTGAALTGSSASGAEDEWSDIDLAFGVAAGADRDRVISD